MAMQSKLASLWNIATDFNSHMHILLKHASENGSRAVRAETYVDPVLDKITLVVGYDLMSRRDADNWDNFRARQEIQSRIWECVGIPAPKVDKPLRLQRRLMMARASAAKRVSPRRAES